jgi:hypothetical protein
MFDPSGYSVPPFAVIFWRSGSAVNDCQARCATAADQPLL